MLKLTMLAGLMLLSLIAASAMRLMPHGVETVTPQQDYFRLHNDDGLVAKPLAASRRPGLIFHCAIRHSTF